MTKIQFGTTLNIGDKNIVVGGEDRLAGDDLFISPVSKTRIAKSTASASISKRLEMKQLQGVSIAASELSRIEESEDHSEDSFDEMEEEFEDIIMETSEAASKDKHRVLRIEYENYGETVLEQEIQPLLNLVTYTFCTLIELNFQGLI